MSNDDRLIETIEYYKQNIVQVSSVSSSVTIVEKEKTEFQSRKHISHPRGGPEPKKLKLMEASDSGVGDTLLGIVPIVKESSKKKTSSSSLSSKKSTDRNRSPESKASKDSLKAKPNGYIPEDKSPSDHSRSISPLELLS